MSKKMINEKWTTIIAKYRDSGLTPTQFSKSEGVGRRQIYYWLNKESSKEKSKIEPKKWILVKLESENQLSKNQSLQIKVGYAEIKVTPGFDKNHLLDVLTALKSLC